MIGTIKIPGVTPGWPRRLIGRRRGINGACGASILCVCDFGFGVRRARSALGFLDCPQPPDPKIPKRSELSALQIRKRRGSCVARLRPITQETLLAKSTFMDITWSQ